VIVDAWANGELLEEYRAGGVAIHVAALDGVPDD
jgi:hypothetical protein